MADFKINPDKSKILGIVPNVTVEWNDETLCVQCRRGRYGQLHIVLLLNEDRETLFEFVTRDLPFGENPAARTRGEDDHQNSSSPSPTATATTTNLATERIDCCTNVKTPIHNHKDNNRNKSKNCVEHREKAAGQTKSTSKIKVEQREASREYVYVKTYSECAGALLALQTAGIIGPVVRHYPYFGPKDIAGCLFLLDVPHDGHK